MSSGTFQATLSQSCKKDAKDGTTQATCTQSRSISDAGAGGAFSTVITKTFTGDDYRSDVHRATITAGGKQLTAASGSCTKNGNAAAPTGLGSEVYKIIVVPAAAALAAAVI